MSAEFESAARLAALKSGIESKTGETYADLTEGVQTLMDGYGVGSAPVLTDLEITENGEYIPPDGVDGFSKVVANVAGSGSEDGVLVIPYTKNPGRLFMNSVLPELFEVTLPDASGLEYMFHSASGAKEIIINVPNNPITNMSYLLHSCSVKKVTINGDTSNNASTTEMIRNSSVEELNFMINISSHPSGNYGTFARCTTLVEARLFPNCLTTGPLYVNWSQILSDNTLISFANALNTGAPNKTLTLASTPKARCEEILGTVTQKTSDDGTVYDFFTVDPAGTVTLTEFITNTKGWTLA